MTTTRLRSAFPARNPLLPSAAVDPLNALIDAAIARALDSALERFAELQSAPPNEVMTEDDVCAWLKMSRPTVRKLRPPCVQLGCARRYIRSDLLEWVRRQLPTGHAQATDAESAEYEREAAEVFAQ